MKQGINRVRTRVIGALLAASTLGIFLSALPQAAHADGVPLATGDVLAATGSGQVKHFSSSGTLLDTLDDTSASTYTTGMCFNSSGDMFVTNFSSDTISEFDAGGNLLNATWATVPTIPESCSISAANDMYVGGPGAPTIYEFNSAGTLTNSFAVTGGSGTGGTDWLDLAADQCTILYTGEGSQNPQLQRVHPDPKRGPQHGYPGALLRATHPAQRRRNGGVRIRSSPPRQLRQYLADLHHPWYRGVVLDEPRPRRHHLLDGG